MPKNLTLAQIAKQIDVAPNELQVILDQRGSVTLELAKRFSIGFGTTVQFWLNLQASHDLTKLRHRFKQDLLALKALNLQ